MIRALRAWAYREPELAGLLASVATVATVIALALLILAWALS